MSILYDKVTQLSITKLREWEYVIPGQTKRGVITWSIGDRVTNSISLTSYMHYDDPHIVLSYRYDNESYNQKVRIVSVPSNLGRGEVLYFLCPHTGKRCRKLYFSGGHFFHRDAFIGGMYDIQRESRQQREFTRFCRMYFPKDEVYQELKKKHLKTQYAGKPTKKYARLSELVERSQRIPADEFRQFVK